MPLRQLYPPDEGGGGEQPRVDIVAVHGLNPHSKSDEQHAWDTWRKPAGPTGNLWLRDDLPKVAPQSRIFLYEYNSTLLYGGDKGRFNDKANDLLEALRTERKKDDRRPLIFIGHSLGGILIEQALVNAHVNLKYSTIRESTTSLVFFGTPHAGGDDKLVALGSAAARIAKSIRLQPSNDIIETLKQGSLFTDVLAEHWRQQLEFYQIVSFWEGIGDIVPKKSATFGLSGHRENIVRLNASHSDMCRFDGINQRDKDNLKMVSSNLEDAYDEALKNSYVQSKSPMPAGFTADQQACLQSLHFTEMHWRRDDIADPTPATCAWLLDHTRYHKWIDQGHGLLWIKGNPGSGKSTVLKHVLETAEREPKQNFILASCFFHGRGAPIQRNVLGLFRSLLHQILQQNRVLLSDFTSLYRKRSETEGHYGHKWTWNENQLQSFFKSKVVHTARTHQMRIYIDALDECGQDIALDVVDFFRRFTALISVCFCCRYSPHVALEGGNEVCVEHENKQDIETYIQDNIRAHIRRPDIAETIRNEVVPRSQGNFQWVVLVMPRVLKLHKSRKRMVTIQTMIRSIPPELSELYTDTLEGIKEHERAQSLHFMQWMCFAFRPLTLTELRFAMAVSADTSYTSIHQFQGSEFYVETDEDMKLRICDLSKGLAEVSENNGSPIVQFIHQSVKDFLLEEGLQILDKSFAGAVAGGGHFWILRSCIKLFHMEEVQNAALSLEHMNISGSNKVESQDYFSLLKYSVVFWPLHAAEVEGANIPQDQLAALTSETPDGVLKSWFTIHRIVRSRVLRLPSRDSTLLHVASRHNLVSVVKALLTLNVWADQPNNYPRTSLSIAASKGHEGVVQLLLKQDDVDVNYKDFWGNTPLSLAALRGHKAVAEVLTNWKDTDLNSENYDGNTPLSVAARQGHDEIIRILLTRDVKMDSKNGREQTPLHQATIKGHYQVVKLLLQHSANIDARDKNDDTPLSIATYGGHYDVVKLLLQHNANIEARNLYKRTPLSIATYGGHYDVVKLLLQHNADIEAKDYSDRTPLCLAMGQGHYKVVELLLQNNADIDARDRNNTTPLLRAALMGHYQLVELLLQRTRDVNGTDEYGRTPLSCASGNGHPETVELFLGRSDVDVNLKDTRGRSPLSWALARGSVSSSSRYASYMAIVDLLLSRHDISVSEQDEAALRTLGWEGKLRR